MNKRLTLILLAFSLILNGCAAGNKHSYHDVSIKFKVENLSKLAVATLDQRSYVKNGDKKPNFVGLQRGGYGIPFDVSTVSGRPLAEDMTTTLVQSLKKQGVDAIAVPTEVISSIESISSNLLESKADRSLLLILREWKSDTKQRTALEFDITLMILNDLGKVLAEETLNGRNNLGGAAKFNPMGHAKEKTPFAFKKTIEFLLNKESISSALK